MAKPTKKTPEADKPKSKLLRPDADLRELLKRAQGDGRPLEKVSPASRLRSARQARDRLEEALGMMAEAYANSALLVRILERTEEPEIRAVADEAARVSLKQKNLSALDDVPRDYGGRDARHAVNRILNALNDLGLVNEGGH